MKNHLFKWGSSLLLTVFASSSEAATITLPGDPIKGRELLAGVFTEATQTGAANTNTTPASGNENAPNAIDGVITTKYLNFGREDTGYIVIPTLGSSIVTGIDFVTGNDSPGRDPASYILFGSNSLPSLPGAALTIAGSGFTQISAGSLSLPNTGANLTGTLTNSEGRGNAASISFANSTAYKAYILTFPSVRSGTDNSMQIAEARLTGTVVPEPAVKGFMAVNLLGLTLRRRR